MENVVLGPKLTEYIEKISPADFDLPGRLGNVFYYLSQVEKVKGDREIRWKLVFIPNFAASNEIAASEVMVPQSIFEVIEVCIIAKISLVEVMTKRPLFLGTESQYFQVTQIDFV